MAKGTTILFLASGAMLAASTIVTGSEGEPRDGVCFYENADYLKAAPWAKLTLESINSADPLHPTVKPVPYTGVQFVAIPQFQGIGTDVGQDFSAALAGTVTVDQALAKAQASTEDAMKKSGYIN